MKAQYVSSPLYKKLFNLEDFAMICETEIAANNGHILLKETMKLIETEFGREKVIELFAEDLSSFLGEMDGIKFLKENHFEYVRKMEQEPSG